MVASPKPPRPPFMFALYAMSACEGKSTSSSLFDAVVLTLCLRNNDVPPKNGGADGDDDDIVFPSLVVHANLEP